MTESARQSDDLKLHLRVLGGEHEITARVQLGATKVSELLPVARAISEGITRAAIDVEQAAGKAISCRAGCTACCRHLVPISTAEAVRLAEVVLAMPKGKRSEVRKRFEKALKQMERAGLLGPLGKGQRVALLSSKTSVSERWNDVSRRYFEANVACPFLEDELCSVYSERPMACREFLVTTPAERCATWDGGAREVPRPARMSEVMNDAANALLERQDPSLPLALLLEWASSHKAAFEREGDGEEMVRALLAHIEIADERETSA